MLIALPPPRAAHGPPSLPICQPICSHARGVVSMGNGTKPSSRSKKRHCKKALVAGGRKTAKPPHAAANVAEVAGGASDAAVVVGFR